MCCKIKKKRGRQQKRLAEKGPAKRAGGCERTGAAIGAIGHRRVAGVAAAGGEVVVAAAAAAAAAAAGGGGGGGEGREVGGGQETRGTSSSMKVIVNGRAGAKRGRGISG